MLLTSREKAKAMGRLNRSITRGQGNLAGFVGEEIAAKVLNAKFDNLTKNIDYDLILPDGRTVDVKTKRTSVEPKSHYECSISTYYQQKCDLYAFVRVHNDLHTGWFLGIYDRDEFFKDCTHRKKGDVDPSNNFRFKSDTFNLKISQLRSAEYATTT
jgi:hypothetical protein